MVSFVLAIFSGVLLSGAFAPLNWWFLLPISIALFLYSVTKTRKPFLTSFIFAAVFNYLTLKWSGIYVGLLPVFFLVLLQSIFYLPLGFISYRRNRYSRVWLLLPVLLITDEIRSIIPFGGFGWNRLSFSQADSPYIMAAAYFGDSVLAFLGISLGIALYLLCARAQLFSVAIISGITTVAVLLPVPVIGQGSVNVLAVQGNVPKLGLDFNSRAQEVFNYHLRQTDFALKAIPNKPDVIIWPENSVDIDPFTNLQVGEKISNLAKQIEVPVIVGAVLKGSEGPENASVMWNSDGLVSSKYVKRSLTPFGEYIPLRKLASAISPFADGVVDFVSGNEIVLHQVGRAAIAPIICYEIIDDSAVHSISKNSNLLIVQTNNATFADSGQSAQQLNITRIRAVENSRWIVSISTTGVSAIIDNSGGIQQITKQNSASFLSGDVALTSGTSLAYKIGNWSAFLCILFSIAIYLGKRRRDA
jgi:apolipoprotein N-acyltransferase